MRGGAREHGDTGTRGWEDVAATDRIQSERPGLQARRGCGAFTLIELLVAAAVFLLLMVMVVSVTDRVSGIWRGTSDAIGAWQGARNAYESLTRRISQATLDTTWAYFDKDGNVTASDPVRFGRHSQLQFVSGPGAVLLPGETDVVSQAVFFQSPLGRTRQPELKGLPALLNACGFYVQFNNDADFRPDAAVFNKVTDRWRFRLMELVEPSENLQVYATKDASDFSWFQTPVQKGLARPLADNIIALIVLPRFSSLDSVDRTLLAPDYIYNSRVSHPFSGGGISGNTLHQLPPLLQVTMVVLSEKSATRLAEESKTAMPSGLFTDAPFIKASQYDKDLQTLEGNLTSRHLTYRIFSSIIAIRGAKWSQE